MTPEMKQKAYMLRCPVFRLRRPLYGWSRSGNIWEKHLAETLQSLDEKTELDLNNKLSTLAQTTPWKPVDNWPQTFWKRNKQGRIVMLTVYVDDFVMAGPDHMDEWKAIRDVITTTVPEKIGRVLGVHYNFTSKGEGKSEVIMDMKDYMLQALEMYHSVPGAPQLRDQVHYPWYEPTLQEIETMTSQPGLFAHCSASLLM
jgi:hypothetical protein